MQGRGAVLAISWVVWMEQNRRIFEGARAEEVDHLWDRVKCMALFGR